MGYDCLCEVWKADEFRCRSFSGFWYARSEPFVSTIVEYYPGRSKQGTSVTGEYIILQSWKFHAKIPNSPSPTRKPDSALYSRVTSQVSDEQSRKQ